MVTAKAKAKVKTGGKKTKGATVKVKAKVKSKVKVTAKVKAKSKAKPTPKVVAKAKPAPKAVAKVKPKPKAKPAPKSVARVSAKPAPKMIAKSVTKLAAKAVAKVTPSKMPTPATKPAPKTLFRVETRVVGVPTELELVKQPKGDYMSAAQLKFFKSRLLELRTQLRENADATTEHLRELAVAPDPADRATQEEEHALELRTRDRERKLLKKIEGALLRIEDGSYGYCEETGDPIGVPRLLARPTATLTIEAQERREMKQKMYGE